jgi:hypothetical protein
MVADALLYPNRGRAICSIDVLAAHGVGTATEDIAGDAGGVA